MRKQLITPTPKSARPSDQTWLDVDSKALVQVTSEENGYPIESALTGETEGGWRAANPGTQTIRIIFDEPNDSDAYSWFSRTLKIHGRKSSSFGGLRMADILSEKLCVSGGILAHPVRCERQRTMQLNSPKSRYLN
jgi:hypothetical protein